MGKSLALRYKRDGIALGDDVLTKSDGVAAGATLAR